MMTDTQFHKKINRSLSVAYAILYAILISGVVMLVYLFSALWITNQGLPMHKQIAVYNGYIYFTEEIDELLFLSRIEVGADFATRKSLQPLATAEVQFQQAVDGLWLINWEESYLARYDGVNLVEYSIYFKHDEYRVTADRNGVLICEEDRPLLRCFRPDVEKGLQIVLEKIIPQEIQSEIYADDWQLVVIGQNAFIAFSIENEIQTIELGQDSIRAVVSAGKFDENWYFFNDRGRPAILISDRIDKQAGKLAFGRAHIHRLEKGKFRMVQAFDLCCGPALEVLGAHILNRSKLTLELLPVDKRKKAIVYNSMVPVLNWTLIWAIGLTLVISSVLMPLFISSWLDLLLIQKFGTGQIQMGTHQMRLAGLTRRGIVALLDRIFSFSLALVLFSGILYAKLWYSDALELGLPAILAWSGWSWIFFPALLILFWFCRVWLEGRRGRTPAQYLLGTKVYLQNGNQPSGLRAAFTRSLMWFLDFATMGLTALYCMAHDVDRKSMGDRIAGTLVLRGAGQKPAGN